MYNKNKQNDRSIPVLFISYGYVPLYQNHKLAPEFIQNLQMIGSYLRNYYKINNIIAISAHKCLKGTFLVSQSDQLKISHDHPFEFYYDIEKIIKSSSQISSLVINLLRAYQIDAQPDQSGTIDSSIWGPLQIMFPDLDYPVVSISVNKNYDPETHLNIGKLLEEYKSKGSLIICFGGITQNIHQFYEALVDEKKVKEPLAYNQFDGWCKKVIETMKGKDRQAKIMEYFKHPHFNKVHPTQEHFMPVLVAIGASGSCPGKAFHQQMFKKCMSLSSYIFEEVVYSS
ncbi:aromatic ring-opening dioxygenase catalytic subunit LigB (macronuclear) [Tetrahymena thermophila SB210]|uniref:Aromatic ring-opening dioxygenase catalytic subunit LigB n=1 Tax=Tetrahymena thermophila (strain SB210) TaxID=312017 RepID=I7M6D3_TETTS|nr:aromatic ring-opening dioxygenase catalytic subunit LigB [Tetrahymena thermophila SB210]EAR84997.1 aromatic ring-opening dioxygenase catalytic subunit LigB [Tetrahymena thermophila SB210]|eukprot:XP_001032660.1 aromatic ring-opening dioxygenase catalytic subunit LigB [Tetrahymena thermophila SB210]